MTRRAAESTLRGRPGILLVAGAPTAIGWIRSHKKAPV